MPAGANDAAHTMIVISVNRHGAIVVDRTACALPCYRAVIDINYKRYLHQFATQGLKTVSLLNF